LSVFPKNPTHLGSKIINYLRRSNAGNKIAALATKAEFNECYCEHA
jgi:hypothetical protein